MPFILLFVNVRKYITTRHLNFSYISILTNLLQTVKETTGSIKNDKKDKE